MKILVISFILLHSINLFAQKNLEIGEIHKIKIFVMSFNKNAMVGINNVNIKQAIDSSFQISKIGILEKKDFLEGFTNDLFRAIKKGGEQSIGHPQNKSIKLTGIRMLMILHTSKGKFKFYISKYNDFLYKDYIYNFSEKYFCLFAKEFLRNLAPHECYKQKSGMLRD